MKNWKLLWSVVVLSLNLGCLNAVRVHEPQSVAPGAQGPPTQEEWLAACEMHGQGLYPSARIELQKVPTFDLVALEWRERLVGIDVQQPFAAHLVGWKVLPPSKVWVGRVITRLSLYDADVRTMQTLRTIPSGAGLSMTELHWMPDATDIPDAWMSSRVTFSFRRRFEKKRSTMLFEILPFQPSQGYVARKIDNFTGDEATVPYSLTMFHGMAMPGLEKDGLAGAALMAMLPSMQGRLRLEIETVELMDAQAESLGCIAAGAPKPTTRSDLYLQKVLRTSRGTFLLAGEGLGAVVFQNTKYRFSRGACRRSHFLKNFSWGKDFLKNTLDVTHAHLDQRGGSRRRWEGRSSCIKDTFGCLWFPRCGVADILLTYGKSRSTV